MTTEAFKEELINELQQNDCPIPHRQPSGSDDLSRAKSAYENARNNYYREFKRKYKPGARLKYLKHGNTPQFATVISNEGMHTRLKIRKDCGTELWIEHYHILEAHHKGW